MEIDEGYKVYMQDIVKSLPATIFFKDTEGKYVFTTKTCDLINAGRDRTIIGKRDYEIQFDKAIGQRYYEEDMRILETGESTHTIDEIDNGSGDIAYIEVIKQPIRNDEGEIIGICGICNDVTELENLRRQYKKLSLFDSMTGAYNRNYTFDYNFDNEDCLPCSYIFCDCNNLKKINDNLGHEMGDKYIMEAFRILLETLNDNSIIVRWGGDEFLIITPNCDAKAHDGMLENIQTSQRRLSDIRPEMGISVGGMIRESMDVSESFIMKLADEKMYENKKQLSDSYS